MESLSYFGRFHRGAGLFVTACSEIGGVGGKGSRLLGPRTARRGTALSFETEEAPVGTPGLPNGRSPLRGGEDDRPIRLNSDQSPAVPHRIATPLTPSLLVRVADPRHD